MLAWKITRNSTTCETRHISCGGEADGRQYCITDIGPAWEAAVSDDESEQFRRIGLFVQRREAADFCDEHNNHPLDDRGA